MAFSIDRQSKRGFHPALAPSLATAVLLPLLIGLGLWQLQRAQEKQRLFDAMATAQRALPQPVIHLHPSPLPQHAHAAGHYDHLFFLLDNRVRHERAGYEVLAPLLLDDGRAVLVDRGWLPQGVDRAHLPGITLPAGPIQVEGVALTPEPPPFALSAQETFTTGWPKVVQTAVPKQLAMALGYPLLPVVIYPDGSEAAAHEVAALHAFTPARHYAYAAQWFVMATVLLILYLRHALRRPRGES